MVFYSGRLFIYFWQSKAKELQKEAGESEQNFKKEGMSHKDIPKHQHEWMSFYCHLGEGTKEEKQQ